MPPPIHIFACKHCHNGGILQKDLAKHEDKCALKQLKTKPKKKEKVKKNVPKPRQKASVTVTSNVSSVPSSKKGVSVLQGESSVLGGLLYADVIMEVNTLEHEIIDTVDAYFLQPEQVNDSGSRMAHGITLTDSAHRLILKESALLGTLEDCNTNPLFLNTNEPFCIVTVGVQGIQYKYISYILCVMYIIM